MEQIVGQSDETINTIINNIQELNTIFQLVQQQDMRGLGIIIIGVHFPIQ